ncbi:hypothetical protein SAMN05216436_104144 [bacterium A37T11]|nr:hypothetical protein SAMN05216436_104144 [bacterium A37T11]
MLKPVYVLVFLFLGISSTAFSQMEPFPLSRVRLSASPFLIAQQTDLRYMMALDPDRLLSPYLREAGLHPVKPGYGNWENTGLDGHILGQYVSALSMMEAATGKNEVRERLQYILKVLDSCQSQRTDGYLGGIPGGAAMWAQVGKGDIRAGAFDLNGKWVPWYNLHKLFSGLLDAWTYTGDGRAKKIVIKLADWWINLSKGISNEAFERMLQTEYGGMNEVYADLADKTHEDKYLQMARRFNQKVTLDPLLEKHDVLNGLHANTQIPKVIGYKREEEVDGDDSLLQASEFFWETVIDHRTVSIGGNSVSEHFHPSTDFSSMIESREGPETCNTYNMLKLTRMLFLTEPLAKFMDYYERATFNHILSSEHPDKGGFVYFTSMRPQHYRVYSQPQESFWCCVGSGMENHAKYGELIYTHLDKDLFVNLFIPSSLDWKEMGIKVRQLGSFPFEEGTELRLGLDKAKAFTLYIRKPVWLGGEMQIWVNGARVKALEAKPGYLGIDRIWKDNDHIKVSLPMRTRVEWLPDGSPWVSFVHGPVVLAAITGHQDLTGLLADGSRMGHIASGSLIPIKDAPIVVSDDSTASDVLKPVKGKPLTFSLGEHVWPQKFQGILLQPFFSIHDARYMVYWPIATKKGLDSLKRTLRSSEEAALALDALTVDHIATGEQQPENDHGYQGDNSSTGVAYDRHWRDARGWFSYVLRDPDKQAKTLRVTYHGDDRGRKFNIYLDGRLLKEVVMDGEKPGQFFDADYAIPSGWLDANQDGRWLLRFEAANGSFTAGVYGIRLLK